MVKRLGLFVASEENGPAPSAAEQDSRPLQLTLSLQGPQAWILAADGNALVDKPRQIEPKLKGKYLA